MCEVSEHDECKHKCITAHPLHGYGSFKVLEYAREHFGCGGKILRAKKYPAEANEMKCEQHTECAHQKCFRHIHNGAEEFVNGERHSMQKSPEYKVPRSAMPQATEQHGDEQVYILAQFAFAVSAERHI